ncbi:hypothetical protein [Salidesulfovibrio onnuriiensis]|uniref:hypothetical protein n=1 Tax=Salidesulfovibrio onnuriiensis TaxID=2583823 RepID=UPI0011CCBE19|nr:hypothetical protein [Salidesulfovibrio onnuriiensis]
MNPFFVFHFIRNLVAGKDRKKSPERQYTESGYYRGQDYDEHVYDRGEDHGLDKDGERPDGKRDD